MECDREKYEKFFNVFGTQLKYGIIGDYGMKRDLLTDLPAVRTGDQPQQDHKHGVANHDSGENEDLRRDAQQVGEHRGEQAENPKGI